MEDLKSKNIYLVIMDREPMWFFHSHVLSSPSYCLYRYLLWVIQMRPKTLPEGFVEVYRSDLQRKMGMAYNSIQAALSELVVLGMIEIDPNKNGNKNLISLRKPDQFNHVLIKERLSKSFLKILEQQSKTSKDDESDK